jgi:hypothetical protein
MNRKPNISAPAVKKGALILLACSMSALALYGGVIFYKNIFSYKANMQEQLALAKQEQIVQEAQEKRQEQIRILQEMAFDLKKGEYDSLISFFSMQQQDYTGQLVCVQNSMLISENLLQADAGQTILLDYDNGSFYVGNIDENGKRSGQGIQFGYEVAYESLNSNLSKVSAPAIFIYKGEFENNLASGSGTYTRMLSVSSQDQSAIVYKGTFSNHQMDGLFEIGWAQDGKSYTDEIIITQGSFETLFSFGSGYVYARDWNGLLPINLCMYEQESLENTCLWYGYLAHYANESMLHDCFQL